MSDPSIEFPGWYQFFKDFVPLWTSIVALVGGWLAYRGVMAKVKVDRLVSTESREARATYVSVEINRCARMMMRTTSILLGAETKADLYENWNTTLRTRFMSDADAVDEAIGRLYDFIAEAEVRQMDQLNRRLQTLKHAGDHLRRVATRIPHIDGASPEEDLEDLLRIASAVLMGLKRMLPQEPLDIQIHFDHPALTWLKRI